MYLDHDGPHRIVSKRNDHRSLLIQIILIRGEVLYSSAVHWAQLLDISLCSEASQRSDYFTIQ